MPLIFDWFDKIQRYTKFKPKELKAAILTIIVLSFAISFRHWGIGKEVDFSYGIVYFVGAVLIVGISFLARTATSWLKVLAGAMEGSELSWEREHS